MTTIICNCDVKDNKKQYLNKGNDPESKFLLSMLGANYSDTSIFIAVNPSFCGSCNENFIEYLKKFESRFQVTFLMSSKDEKIEHIVGDLKNATILHPAYETMEKHGLTGPYNSIYFTDQYGVYKKLIIVPENYREIDQFAK